MKNFSAWKAIAPFSLLLLAACNGVPGSIGSKDAAAPGASAAKVIPDDVVVVAVLDSNMNPYHWDYLASKMPDSELPLDQDPSTWLPGFPDASTFKSFTSINLHFDDSDPEASTSTLHDEDQEEWNKIVNSEGNSNGDVNYYWFPGTKIVGHVSFAGSGPVDPWAASSHGIGTSSVSTGNIHGTCPHCVLVYVHGAPEIAQQWVEKQDWIDLQTNSYGDSANSAVLCIAPADIACGLVRDLIYAGADTEMQRQTVERGQSIFFSGGNGLINDFSVPHTNLVSSQKGPDWIITVGAIESGGLSPYTGAGKPVDIASLGDGYPSAYGPADNVTNEGPFSGTSNASPVIAGMYGEALYRIRKQIGSKRMQHDGVIAEGKAGCGAANPNCALADGKLTVHELREALFRSAQYTGGDGVYIGDVGLQVPASTKEVMYLSEGHGALLGRFAGNENYETEMARIVGFADGSWYAEQEAEQRDWMTADSLCRQGGWGSWDFGYAPLNAAPTPDPQWPVRTWMAQACPSVLGALVTAEIAAGINGEPPLAPVPPSAGAD